MSRFVGLWKPSPLRGARFTFPWISADLSASTHDAPCTVPSREKRNSCALRPYYTASASLQISTLPYSAIFSRHIIFADFEDQPWSVKGKHVKFQ